MMAATGHGWEVMRMSGAGVASVCDVVWTAWQTALHSAAFKQSADAIRALKEVGFTAFDAQDKNGEVSMLDWVCGGLCAWCEGCHTRGVLEGWM